MSWHVSACFQKFNVSSPRFLFSSPTLFSVACIKSRSPGIKRLSSRLLLVSLAESSYLESPNGYQWYLHESGKLEERVVKPPW